MRPRQLRRRQARFPMRPRCRPPVTHTRRRGLRMRGCQWPPVRARGLMHPRPPRPERLAPLFRRELRAGGERLNRNGFVLRATLDHGEHAPLVRGERDVSARSNPNVEDVRAALLDVEEIPRGEVEHGRCRCLVRDLEAVDEKIRNSRGLGAEDECEQPRRRTRRRSKRVREGGGREPEERADDGTSDHKRLDVPRFISPKSCRFTPAPC